MCFTLGESITPPLSLPRSSVAVKDETALPGTSPPHPHPSCWENVQEEPTGGRKQTGFGEVELLMGRESGERVPLKRL